MRQYKQLTREQRYFIYVLKQEKNSNRQIARMIKVHHSTVSRELQRNIWAHYKVYRHGTAHRLAIQRRKLCRKPVILTPEKKMFIVSLLKKHWSPEQISGRLKRENVMSISHQSIYNYIWKNKESGGKVFKYLRRKRKYRKRSISKISITGRIMIDERPSVVNLRNRIGDWEVDTIVSRKHKDVLVTLVERYSRFTLVGKSLTKHSSRVSKVIRDVLRFHKNKVFTITSDNGTEFAQHKRIGNWLDAGFYFCHPYSSWERGLNENTNGLIRQYAPKGSSFSHFTSNHLKQLMSNLNNRPRKCLDYKTPKEVYYNS